MMKHFKEKLDGLTILLICILSPFASLFFDKLDNKMCASGITFFTLLYLYRVFKLKKLKSADELDNKCNSVDILIFLLWCICLVMWVNVTKYIIV